jgi:two-component system, NarL family, response regulator LiaR
MAGAAEGARVVINNQSRIRVAIVDDHAVVRSGLAALLLAYRDLELVGEAAGGSEAVRLCNHVHPDVVIMDLMMPGMDGAAATEAIRRTAPDVKVLMLTSCRETESVKRALLAGANGYLLKDVTPAELVKAIRDTAAGHATLGREATEALIQVVTRASNPGTDLTDRERDVLALLVAGLSNPEIAERLVVSRSTVKFHLSSIFGKLGVSTRTEAVAQAMQRHLVS